MWQPQLRTSFGHLSGHLIGLGRADNASLLLMSILDTSGAIDWAF